MKHCEKEHNYQIGIFPNGQLGSEFIIIKTCTKCGKIEHNVIKPESTKSVIPGFSSNSTTNQNTEGIVITQK